MYDFPSFFIIHTPDYNAFPFNLVIPCICLGNRLHERVIPNSSFLLHLLAIYDRRNGKLRVSFDFRNLEELSCLSGFSHMRTLREVIAIDFNYSKIRSRYEGNPKIIKTDFALLWEINIPIVNAIENVINFSFT